MLCSCNTRAHNVQDSQATQLWDGVPAAADTQPDSYSDFLNQELERLIDECGDEAGSLAP